MILNIPLFLTFLVFFCFGAGFLAGVEDEEVVLMTVELLTAQLIHLALTLVLQFLLVQISGCSSLWLEPLVDRHILVSASILIVFLVTL